MAKSSFSHVPALLRGDKEAEGKGSGGCVVYEPFWHLPMEGWIRVDGTGNAERLEARLRGCLQLGAS